MAEEVQSISMDQLVVMYQKAAKTNQVLNDAYDKVTLDLNAAEIKIAELTAQIEELKQPKKVDRPKKKPAVKK